VVYAVGLGGDTDTIGAMTGAITGGYHGKSGIPFRWLDRIENEGKGRDYIERLGMRLWETSGKA
jgi:poly(ADP-ribose) glycohydrolase ARH3